MKIEEMSAWGLTQTIAQIIEEGFSYDEETGEVFFTSDDLDKLQETLENKLNNLCGYIKYCDSKAESFKKRADELKENQKYYEGKADKLKKYANELMIASGKEKVETNDFRLSFRKSVSSEIFDEQALMKYINSKDEYKEKYLKYKQPEIAKKEIADEVKKSKQDDGTYTLQIPGFRLVENQNIQIK